MLPGVGYASTVHCGRTRKTKQQKSTNENYHWKIAPADIRCAQTQISITSAHAVRTCYADVSVRCLLVLRC